MFKTAFGEVESREEVRKLFLKLSKIHHPDKGGSEENFKILNAQYNEALEKIGYEVLFDKIEISPFVKEKANSIRHLDGLEIEIVGSWIWIDGNTKEHKEELKEKGFKYAFKKKKRYFGKMKGRNGKSQEMETIRNKYGSIKVKKAKSKTRQGIK